MMLALGTASAVPILLILNTIVSIVACRKQVIAENTAMIARTAFACLLGIGIGTFTQSSMSEAALLAFTGLLLLIGLASNFLHININTAGYVFISVLAGLATAWAATPGPLMVLGMLAIGTSASKVRELVQPIALVAYAVALILRLPGNWHNFEPLDDLSVLIICTIVGSILGRVIGPKLPHALISKSIRILSLIAAVALFWRAATLM